MQVVRPAPDVTRGYILIEGESVARSRGEYAPGDLNESFMIGPVDVGDDEYYRRPAAGKHFAPNLWPRRPAALRAAYTTYFQTMADLVSRDDVGRAFTDAIRPHADAGIVLSR